VLVSSALSSLSAVRQDWPLWIVFASAGLAGACIPPVSSMIRVRWTHLLRGSHRLPTAPAMEAVGDEFLFLVGRGVVPAFPLAAVGSLLFAAQTKTEPPPTPHEHRNGPSAIRTPGLRVLFV